MAAVLPKDLRVVFMGTPDFAVPALREIMAAGFNVRAVYTREPKAKGRGLDVQKTPVHMLADAHGIDVYTPKSFRKNPGEVDAFLGLCVAEKIDVAVVAAYGLILPQAVLDAPRFGCLNIHASLLPRWRGASPIHHMIWHGDAHGGVTIMQMDAGLDTGDMIDIRQDVGEKPIEKKINITDTMTTQMLQDKLAEIGAQQIVSVLKDIAADKIISRIPQPVDGVTHAPMLKKEDGRVNWGQTATQIDQQIRALNPWPGTFTTLPNGDVIKILHAQKTDQITDKPSGVLLDRAGHVACGHQTVLRVTQIQTPNGKKMEIAALMNGGAVKIGDILS